MLSIITVPDPRLRQKSRPITSLNKDITQYISDLGEKLVKKNDPPGVGISAVQTGNLIQLIALYLPENLNNPHPPSNHEKFELTYILNPVILDQSDTLTLGPDKKRPLLEGCLSIPSLYAPVLRHDWIDLKYDTIDYSSGNPVLVTRNHIRFSGFPARVMQHEIDHLNGILFTDYILKQNQPLYFDQSHDLVEIADPLAILKW